VTSGGRRAAVLGAAGLASAAGYAALARLAAPADRVDDFAFLWFVLSLLYWAACGSVMGAPQRMLPAAAFWIVVGGALAFRLTVAPLAPEFSEDLYRYRWQGKLQAAGGNPYTERPEDPRWAGLRDSTWDRVNRKDLPSVYGPVYEAAYAGWYRLAAWTTDDEERQAWSFKLPFAAAELAAGVALVWLLGVYGLPRERAVVYLWSPLVVFEFWAQGHNDPLAVLFVLLALGWREQDRRHRAFAALAVATMAKFWPAMLFPFFALRREGGRWRFYWRESLTALAVAAALAAPYGPSVAEAGELLRGFVGGWRNNDSLFGLVLRAADGDFERATRIVSLGLAVALAGLWVLRPALSRAALWAPVALLLLAANCFPWYLVWFLPLLAVHPNAALLLWTSTAVLAYHVLIPYRILGEWRYDEWFLALEYAPVFALLVGTPLGRRYWAWRSRVANASASGSGQGQADR
jgi:alpha-1,6-mannosyltransferase